MIGLAAGKRIWIVAGVTDMRRGFTGLSGMEHPPGFRRRWFRGHRGTHSSSTTSLFLSMQNVNPS